MTWRRRLHRHCGCIEAMKGKTRRLCGGLRPRSNSFKQPSATSPPRYAAVFPTSQGQEGDGGESPFDSPQRLCAAFGGRKRLASCGVGHSLRKREEPEKSPSPTKFPFRGGRFSYRRSFRQGQLTSPRRSGCGYPPPRAPCLSRAPSSARRSSRTRAGRWCGRGCRTPGRFAAGRGWSSRG